MNILTYCLERKKLSMLGFPQLIFLTLHLRCAVLVKYCVCYQTVLCFNIIIHVHCNNCGHPSNMLLRCCLLAVTCYVIFFLSLKCVQGPFPLRCTPHLSVIVVDNPCSLYLFSFPQPLSFSESVVP